MKKLTAGILASLIGLVSANSADAAVASKNYVDEGLATKQNVLENAKNVITSGTGAFVTGISAQDGVVTVSYGDQTEVEVDAELSNTSLNPVQNKVITTKIEGMDFSATDTTGVVQTVTQEDGAVTATYGLIGTADVEDGAITSGKIADGTIVDADVNTLSISKISNLQTELDAKQLKLTSSGEGANVTVKPTTDKDNVVTGISAANGVVEVTTGYFDHSNTEYEGVKDVDIVADTDNDGKLEVYTEYYDAQNTADNTGEDWYVLMRKNNGDGTFSYSWENIDRSYEAQPAQPTQE